MEQKTAYIGLFILFTFLNLCYVGFLGAYGTYINDDEFTNNIVYSDDSGQVTNVPYQTADDKRLGSYLTGIATGFKELGWLNLYIFAPLIIVYIYITIILILDTFKGFL